MVPEQCAFALIALTIVSLTSCSRADAKKLNLTEIADHAVDKFDEDADEENGGSGMGTPGAEFTVRSIPVSFSTWN